MTDRCRDVLERLVEGITGSLPPSERPAIVAHLAACPRCRDEAAALEAVAAHLREAGGVAVPPGFWAAFMRRLDERLEADRMPVSARLRRWLASPRHALGTAVVTVVAVLAVFAAVRTIPPPPPDPVVIRARGLVTETMTSSLPSLGEMLEVWRAGLVQESDALADRKGR